MSIRGNIARKRSGGPQYQVLPDRMLVEIQGETSLTELVNEATDEAPSRLQFRPVGNSQFSRVESALDNLGSETKRLENLGVLVIEVPKMEQFINSMMRNSHIFDSDVSKLESVLESARNSEAGTVIGGFGPGVLNFGGKLEEMEASLRNELIDDTLTNPVTEVLEGMDGILNVDMSRRMATFGPRSLNLDPFDAGRRLFEGDDGSDKTTLEDVMDKMNVQEAWDIDSGDSAVCAIFDTSFCKDHFSSNRIIDSFSGPDVESAFSDPSEGHGSMCAYSAAGNAEESKFDYNGIAKDADLLLARVSGPNGGLVYMAEAWDWLIGTIKELDRPVISNHSYGMPVCGARGMGTCGGLVFKMAKLANQRSDHQAFYAAGNEAIYCGHRLSGITNGVNGINSDTTTLTSGAFRFDLQDAQNYSSHGFGTCTNAGQNPKPDFGFMLPQILPYGCEESDMSSGYGGSGGGTSAASPLNAGVATIIASITGSANRRVIENIMESTAEQPRTTQINAVRNHDARFGHGQVQPAQAAERASKLTIEPTAGFTISNSEVELGDVVNFDGSVTQTGDSSIISYEWDLGRGQSASGAQVSESYNNPGEVEITLTVEDDRGDTDSITKSLNVVGEPQAIISIPQRTFEPGENILFDGSDSLNSESYIWNLGDGTVATGAQNNYSYDEQGDYTVTLEVENDIGQTDVTQTTVRIDAPDPQAIVTADETEVEVGTQVQLDASNSNNAASYSWDLGDGSTASGATNTHSYDAAREYNVVVEVQNQYGEVSTDSITITVTEPEPEDGNAEDNTQNGGDSNEQNDSQEEASSGVSPLGLIDLGLFS
jgi:PKD repeat protein